MKSLWLLLAVLGAVLPLAVFFGAIPAVPVVEGGLLSAFYANRAAGAASTDVVWSSLVFWVAMAADCRARQRAFPWWILPVNLLIGLSAALPLYLWWRED